jgi:hypothetical protein
LTLETYKILKYIPYLAAAILFALMVWATWLMVHHPVAGVSWSYTTGTINRVRPDNSAQTPLQIGDRIISIAGQSVYTARGLPGHVPGDTVQFDVERNGEVFHTQVSLLSPSGTEIYNRLFAILIASSYWLPGVTVYALSRPFRVSIQFFLFCLGMAAIMALGGISAFGPLWASWIFRALLWWIGPLAIHLHVSIGSGDMMGKLSSKISLLYWMALIFTSIDIGQIWLDFPGFWQTFRYLWLTLTVILSIALLVGDFRRSKSVETRRTSIILALGASIAFLPAMVFSLIPEIIFQQTILPFEASLLSLPALPISYVLVIIYYRIIRLERYISRSAAYFLVVTLSGGIYGMGYLTALRLFPNHQSHVSIAGLATVLVLILVAHPLYRLLQRGSAACFTAVGMMTKLF